MTQAYEIIEKKPGETPLQALERFRSGRPELLGVPLTYAGRLDPMASGALLILIGDECKRREMYDSFDKEYEFEILAGFESDTGDVLGIAQHAEVHPDSPERLRRAAEKMTGAVRLPYPAFSSKTVRGIPLFQYALEKRLGEIDIPVADVRVYSLKVRGARTVSSEALLEEILAKTGALSADADPERLGSDFRKEEIEEKWRQLLKTPGQHTLVACTARVSSGTYIRSLVPAVGKRAATGVLAYSIRRTVIGKYRPVGRFGFWSRILR
ncbi:hypothetical protein K8R03_03430 [Candidatus Kaiserbacteria bacterium]|nr:hypothetical protein [Candidatus Kaiserbacteria bacterium]